MDTFAYNQSQVKSELVNQFSDAIDSLFQQTDEGSTNRSIELNCWKILIQVGKSLVSALLGYRSRQIVVQDIAQRQLSPCQIRPRVDKDYWAHVSTTFGNVSFPWFAYRELKGNGASTTYNPAKDILFPAYNSCRSSSVCLEWESRLGSDHPFREAQQALTYFTHNAVTLEDTTIARHMVRMGQVVTRDDMYRSPDEIRRILNEYATRDRETHKPLLYISSDAHALRRYVDDTWAAQWKMTNGIRLWCEDKKTGQVIHLGGEFTWGDCHEVHRIFEDLIARGILPSDGDYSEGIQAQLVWLSDGMPWFQEHILPLFTDCVVILDAFHLLQHFAAFIALCFRPKSKKARAWLNEVCDIVVGPHSKPKAAKRRRGHKKGTGGKKKDHAHQRKVDPNINPAEQIADLILKVFNRKTSSKKACEAKDRLVEYLLQDPNRINYVAFRARGYQIGSGAMESLHRTASQLRLKIPGAKWRQHTSQAIFNLRMMRLAGNWEQFWNQPDLEMRFADATIPN